jgi:hypothetical protein
MPLATWGLAACTDTPAVVGVTPITGVIIRSDSLVRGLGCGTAPGQVYRYVAAIASDDNVPDGGTPTVYLTANVFDCFADGVFQTIPLPDTGDPSFTVAIAALDKDAYDAQHPAIDPIAAAGLVPAPADGIPASMIAAVMPTWTTTCRATQQQNVAVLAVCDALHSPTIVADAATNDAAADASDAGADAADGGHDATIDANADGAADGASDAATEAASDANADAADAAID